MTTEDKENKIDIELPDSLKRQMKKFEKRLCIMETCVSIFGGIGGAMLTYSILFLSDRLWDTATWLRAPITLSGAVLLGVFAYLWVHRWCLRRRNQSQLAQLIQREYKSLGDRLQGIIELASSEDRPDNVSPALCRAAVKQISGEISKYEFTKAVHTKKARTFFFAFLALFMIIGSTVFFCPDVAWNTLVRWVKPLSSVERYTFVSIHDIPDTQVVPHGEDFIIACQIADESLWHPTNAFCRAEGQPIVESSIEDNAVIFNIPGQISPSDFIIRIGDARKKVRIQPVFRPELLRMNALVTLPDYLERPPQTTKVTGGMMKILQGSTVSLTGFVSREIRDAEMKSHKNRVLTTETNRFTTPLLASTEMKTCVFSWTDSYGLSCSHPYTLTSSIMKDTPPVVTCEGIGRSIAILVDEVVDIKLNAEDDYGLKKLWVTWKSINHKKKKLQEIKGTKVIERGNPTKTSISSHYAFSPIIAGIPEGTAISFYASANDYMPSRKTTDSQRYYIYVLSKAQHEKLLREKLDMILAQLENIARNEEDLLRKNEKIDKLSPKELNSKKTDNALKESTAEERENAESLKKLAAEGEELLKEALRNKDIEAELLEKWAEMFESMKKLSKSDAQKLLKKAAQKKSKRSENLKKAIAEEKEILEALKKLGKELNKSIDDMLAYSIVDRLKAAAGNEGKIGKELQGLVDKIIGMRPVDIPPDTFKKVNKLAQLQKTTRVSVRYIQDDIAGFYNRTRIQEYEDVFKEMNKSSIHKELKKIEDLILKNHSSQSIAMALSKQELLMKWAKHLKPDSDSKSGECGECNKKPTKEDLEILIALARARQQEGSLREQTRALNENKELRDDYEEAAGKLAEMQNDIKKGVDPLIYKINNPKALKFLSALLSRMSEAREMLNKPQTDSATVGVETEIIEMLSGCMSSACSSASSAMSPALMQAMGLPMPGQGKGQGKGQGEGAGGGGSTMTGSTDKPNETILGDNDGDSVDDRDIEMTSGMSDGDIPEEFREVMKAYYNALEEEE